MHIILITNIYKNKHNISIKNTKKIDYITQIWYHICSSLKRFYESKAGNNEMLNKKLVRRGILFLIDISFIFISYIISMYFTSNTSAIFEAKYLYTCIVAAFIYALFFIAFKVYRSITEYTSAREYMSYFFACLLSSGIVTVLKDVLKYEIFGIKENILAACFVAGLMILARVMFRFLLSIREILKNRKAEGHNLLIIGAGSAGRQVIRDVIPKLSKRYNIVGIIDDSVSKKNSMINGINIIGGRDKIESVCEKYKVELILFTIANISKEEKADILNICNKTKAQVKVLPDIKEIVMSNKTIGMKTFKNVQIEDLLGRDPIKLEHEEISNFIEGKTVLVTGGGGSIGSELCRQIASFGAKELLMVDIYENSLYEIELELRKAYPKLDLTAIIASVRDSKRINQIFEKYNPDIVFHAAAHKHVPLMETSPIEAIKNNVFGTYNVAKAASAHEVDKFILVSTDKAVNPTSIMGATKRICEMIIQMQNARSETNYVAVRFGNVLGSNGSVIPIFKKQIAQGGPVTVTHKDITRYFMTIPEAVGLILQAITFAEGGEIFVLDMGEPVKIYDLAEKLVRLSGYEPNVDIQIKITGLRPGEKLYEELLVEEEGLSKTLHDKIMVTKIMDFDMKKVNEDLSILRNLVNSNEDIDNKKVKKVIKKIVPTFIDEKEHTRKKIEEKKTNKSKELELMRG